MGRPPQLDDASIVNAGIERLAEHGLGALTMRQLAADLGVKPAALYWYVASKQELLGRISETIVNSGALSAHVTAILDQTTDATSQQRADRSAATREVLSLGLDLVVRLLSIRDGAEVVSSSYALGLCSINTETVLIAVSHRLLGVQAPEFARAVVIFTVGFAFDAQQRNPIAQGGNQEIEAGVLQEFATALHWLISGAFA